MRRWIFTFAYEVDARHLASYPRVSLEDFIVEECVDRILGIPDALLRGDIEQLFDRVKGATDQHPFDYDLSGEPGILKFPNDGSRRFAFCIENAADGVVTVLSPSRISHLEVVDRARQRYRKPSTSIFAGWQQS